MSSLLPFFTYYGGKWRAAPRYPKPICDTIIEPFAGAAGYALRYADRKVILVEKDARLAALWRYLIAASPAEIETLPLVPLDGHVDHLDCCDDAKSLIGFWLNKGCVSPMKSPSRWMRDGLRPNSFWGKTIRTRIADQVDHIKHWTVIEGGYEEAPSVRASWFVDPPYASAGKAYRHSSSTIDFAALARWCRSREGQVMVCENDGADWLPFKPYLTIKSTEGAHGKAQSKEALWRNTDDLI